MLKLSKMSDYATVLMTLMAHDPPRLTNAVELAERSGIPAPTAAKLLKSLARAGLLQSLRGAHGGYRLAHPPSDISVADVITALEGPIAVTECATHHGGCSLESDCGARSNWQLINHAIRHALESVSLAQMAAPPAARELPVHFRALSSSSPASNTGLHS
ncbi:SUF system Fe-S cluster assembly regulator [Sinimarinibacterium sp. NLF-5-8]|nr:SUF system Fe-S cluster assembly regulator [Sinimarinibacterium sp. NLF-5-8]QHS11357.1 SUF system Fe-S cluster assembly regulator [Sinimarinibacterium sp. NLF-5-8]